MQQSLDRGWNIVRSLTQGLRDKTDKPLTSIDARRLLAEYFTLSLSGPSSLHSAILGCAVKMAMLFPDFHFVPFLDMWGFENLRPEDSDTVYDKQGLRLPSLVERMTTAYAYSLLFHPSEHLAPEIEEILRPVLIHRGYQVSQAEGLMTVTTTAMATRAWQTDVRGRRMTFVTLLLPDGEELVAEVHTITQFSKMLYANIENRLFDIILRHSSNSQSRLRVEAAVLSHSELSSAFALAVGYVDHIDTNHRHIHIFDRESRHFVAKYAITTDIHESQYVAFVPVIPKDSKFKTAVIANVLDNGPEAFGYRNVVITSVHPEHGYCSWELLPDADGTVHPIAETGAGPDVTPATRGYISQSLLDKLSLPMPSPGQHLRIITFLKRGKDKKKRAYVVGL